MIKYQRTFSKYNMTKLSNLLLINIIIMLFLKLTLAFFVASILRASGS